MPNFVHTRLEANNHNVAEIDLPEFPSEHSIKDNTKQVHLAVVDLDDDGLPLINGNSRGSSGASLVVPQCPTALHRPPSALSSHSAGSATSSSSHTTSASQNSSGSSGSLRSSASKLSGTSSMRIKQAMRKVHRRKRASSCDGSGADSDADGSSTHARRRAHAKELLRLDPASASARRSHFAQRANRGDVWFGPNDVITTDFCYGFISFAPTVALQLPGGLSFDLMKYWDGQPVRFVCCERPKGSVRATEGDAPWGRIFWCVAIEMVDTGEEDR